MLSSRRPSFRTRRIRPTTARTRARTTTSSPPTMRPMLAETSASMSIRRPPRVGGPSLAPPDWPPLTAGSPGARCYPSAAMAKRTRYPKTTARPAAKRSARPDSSAVDRPRSITRPSTLDTPLEVGSDMPLMSSSGLTEAEERRAAELEAEATAKERAAIAESLRRRSRAALERDLPATADHNAPLSVRASHEYAYVARDVKRIALTASLMVAILAVLHILVNVLGVISILSTLPRPP